MTFRLKVSKEDFDEVKAQFRANNAKPESHWREGSEVKIQFRSAETMRRLVDALAVRQIGFEIISSN
jgi:hypothetical protein